MMGTTITALQREGNITQIPAMTRLEFELRKDAKAVVYESPIAKGLKKINYNMLPTLEKLTVLTRLLDDNYHPNNTTKAKRLTEISKHIEQLNIDFSKEAETEAFKCLADIILERRISCNNTTLYYAKSDLQSALKKVWINGGKKQRFMFVYTTTQFYGLQSLSMVLQV